MIYTETNRQRVGESVCLSVGIWRESTYSQQLAAIVDPAMHRVLHYGVNNVVAKRTPEMF